MTRVLAALLLALICVVTPADAHTRSQSRSNWAIAGDAVEVRVEAEAVDVTRLYALGEDAPMDSLFAAEVGRAFQVSAGGGACTPSGAPLGAFAAEGRVVARWRVECPGGALVRGPVEIESALFLSVAPSHLHFLALHAANGDVAEAVLTQSHPRARLDLRHVAAAESFWSVLARFAPIGAQHVWTGLDHVAFMLALVLLSAGRLRDVIVAATGFTLGHTATLGLAAIGALRPEAASIEALIGFTIAFVALGVGAGGAARLRAWSTPMAAVLALGGAGALWSIVPMSPLVWLGLATFVYVYKRGFPQGAAWLAIIFGLIHGCGFASALTALDLPKPHLIASLLGFNLGVELGQVVVVGAALLLGLAVKKAPHLIADRGQEWAGAALFALGCFWFASRLGAISWAA